MVDQLIGDIFGVEVTYAMAIEAKSILDLSNVEMSELTGMSVDWCRRLEQKNPDSTIMPMAGHSVITGFAKAGIHFVPGHAVKTKGEGDGKWVAPTIRPPKKEFSKHVEIVHRRLSGETLQSIASEFGVTRQAIEQLFSKYTDDKNNTVYVAAIKKLHS